MSIITRRKYFIPAFFLIWAVICQLFCNIDSYLFAQTREYDTTWYYMCGKSLASGLIPYVDFTDSKGILLWLIYSVAYKIDSYSYVGAYWIMCFNVWGVLMICYKTARLWLERTQAVSVAMLLTVFMCYWNFFLEAKAEAYCWTFVAFALYMLCRKMVGRAIPGWCYVLVGVSVMACLLIKWSVAVMMLSFVASLLWFAYHEKTLIKTFLQIFLGMVMLFFPFAIYLLCIGAFGNFVQEYFLNTIATVSGTQESLIASYAKEWLEHITSRRIVYLLSVLSALILWDRKRWFTSALPVLCGLFFAAICVRHDINYYMMVMAPFGVFPAMIIVSQLSKIGVSSVYVAGAAILGMAVNAWGASTYTGEFCTKTRNIDTLMAVNYVISKVEHPKIISEKGAGSIFGLAEALPASKYWVPQVGETDEMIRTRHEDVLRNRPAFIVLRTSDSIMKDGLDISKLGYKILCETGIGVVFTNQDVKMPDEMIHLTPLDVIKKRSYKEIYSSVKY